MNSWKSDESVLEWYAHWLCLYLNISPFMSIYLTLERFGSDFLWLEPELCTFETNREMYISFLFIDIMVQGGKIEVSKCKIKVLIRNFLRNPRFWGGAWHSINLWLWVSSACAWYALLMHCTNSRHRSVWKSHFSRTANILAALLQLNKVAILFVNRYSRS